MRLSLGAVTIALADAPRPRPRRSGEDPYGLTGRAIGALVGRAACGKA
jgi:hypothetical protein